MVESLHLAERKEIPGKRGKTQPIKGGYGMPIF